MGTRQVITIIDDSDEDAAMQDEATEALPESRSASDGEFSCDDEDGDIQIKMPTEQGVHYREDCYRFKSKKHRDDSSFHCGDRCYCAICSLTVATCISNGTWSSHCDGTFLRKLPDGTVNQAFAVSEQKRKEYKQKTAATSSASGSQPPQSAEIPHPSQIDCFLAASFKIKDMPPLHRTGFAYVQGSDTTPAGVQTIYNSTSFAACKEVSDPTLDAVRELLSTPPEGMPEGARTVSLGTDTFVHAIILDFTSRAAAPELVHVELASNATVSTLLDAVEMYSPSATPRALCAWNGGQKELSDGEIVYVSLIPSGEEVHCAEMKRNVTAGPDPATSRTLHSVDFYVCLPRNVLTSKLAEVMGSPPAPEGRQEYSLVRDMMQWPRGLPSPTIKNSTSGPAAQPYIRHAWSIHFSGACRPRIFQALLQQSWPNHEAFARAALRMVVRRRSMLADTAAQSIQKIAQQVHPFKVSYNNKDLFAGPFFVVAEPDGTVELWRSKNKAHVTDLLMNAGPAFWITRRSVEQKLFSALASSKRGWSFQALTEELDEIYFQGVHIIPDNETVLGMARLVAERLDSLKKDLPINLKHAEMLRLEQMSCIRAMKNCETAPQSPWIRISPEAFCDVDGAFVVNATDIPRRAGVVISLRTGQGKSTFGMYGLIAEGIPERAEAAEEEPAVGVEVITIGDEVEEGEIQEREEERERRILKRKRSADIYSEALYALLGEESSWAFQGANAVTAPTLEHLIEMARTETPQEVRAKMDFMVAGFRVQCQPNTDGVRETGEQFVAQLTAAWASAEAKEKEEEEKLETEAEAEQTVKAWDVLRSVSALAPLSNQPAPQPAEERRAVLVVGPRTALGVSLKALRDHFPHIRAREANCEFFANATEDLVHGQLDVVFTTPHTLLHNKSGRFALDTTWRRLVYDEAHGAKSKVVEQDDTRAKTKGKKIGEPPMQAEDISKMRGKLNKVKAKQSTVLLTATPYDSLTAIFQMFSDHPASVSFNQLRNLCVLPRAAIRTIMSRCISQKVTHMPELSVRKLEVDIKTPAFWAEYAKELESVNKTFVQGILPPQPAGDDRPVQVGTVSSRIGRLMGLCYGSHVYQAVAEKMESDFKEDPKSSFVVICSTHDDVRALHKFLLDKKDGRPLERLSGNGSDNKGKLAKALGVLTKPRGVVVAPFSFAQAANFKEARHVYALCGVFSNTEATQLKGRVTRLDSVHENTTASFFYVKNTISEVVFKTMDASASGKCKRDRDLISSAVAKFTSTKGPLAHAAKKEEKK